MVIVVEELDRPPCETFSWAFVMKARPVVRCLGNKEKLAHMSSPLQVHGCSQPRQNILTPWPAAPSVYPMPYAQTKSGTLRVAKAPVSTTPCSDAIKEALAGKNIPKWTYHRMMIDAVEVSITNHGIPHGSSSIQPFPQMLLLGTNLPALSNLQTTSEAFTRNKLRRDSRSAR